MEKVGVLVYWVYSKVYPQRLIENNRNLIYPVNIKRMPPKTKRIMTPEMLEKLALARAKANETRQAMRSENDELKLKVLQSKIDNIKKTRPTKTPEPKPEAEPVVPEDCTIVDDAPEKANMCELSAPEPEPVPDTINVNDTPPASPVKAKKKKSKKPLVIVSASDSGSSDDNSNVIYIRRKSKSKDKESATANTPQQPPQPPPPPIINPFFSYYHGSQRNFQ